MGCFRDFSGWILQCKGNDQVAISAHGFAVGCVAQLAEQLICNQQVVGSSPSASSLLKHRENVRKDGLFGAKQRGVSRAVKRGQTVNLMDYSFAGSNPAPPIANSEFGLNEIDKLIRSSTILVYKLVIPHSGLFSLETR